MSTVLLGTSGAAGHPGFPDTTRVPGWKAVIHVLQRRKFITNIEICPVKTKMLTNIPSMRFVLQDHQFVCPTIRDFLVEYCRLLVIFADFGISWDCLASETLKSQKEPADLSAGIPARTAPFSLSTSRIVTRRRFL
jgi:hypothetical protein